MDADITLFTEKLKELSEEGKNKTLSRSEILDRFQGIDLTADQINQIIAYLGGTGAQVSDDDHTTLLPEENYHEYDLSDLSLPQGLKKDKIAQAYEEELKAIPLLTDQEISDLSAQAAGGNKEALKKLSSCALRLVFAVARSYYDPAGHIGFYDLIQEGSIGLIKASQKYGKRDIDFMEYALYWIRQTVIAAAAGEGRQHELSGDVAGDLNKIKDAIEELTTEYGMEPSLTQLAEYLEMAPDKLLGLIDLSDDLIKLEDESFAQEDTALSKDLKDRIEPVLDSMRPFEQLVLKMRCGFGGRIEHSSFEVCRRFSISERHLRGIEARALMLSRRGK